MEGIQYHIKCRKGQVNKAVLLTDNPGRAEVIAQIFFENPTKVSENREFRIFNGTFEGLEVAVCSTGIGCMSSAVAIEELANVGCKFFIRVGTAGSLQGDIQPGEIVIATGAVRGDGASKEYIDISYPAVSGFEAIKALRRRAERENCPYHLGIIRSHDAFYLESLLAFGDYKKRIQPWAEAGVLAIENKSATLFVVGSLRRVQVGSILVIAGHLLEDIEYPVWKFKEALDRAVLIACGALADLLKEEER